MINEYPNKMHSTSEQPKSSILQNSVCCVVSEYHLQVSVHTKDQTTHTQPVESPRGLGKEVQQSNKNN